MPRIRTVKPQFWLDENLGTISRDARLLYIGLWNLSDDLGVFEWRPARIKVQLFPYDTDINQSDIEKWLQSLAGTGDVKRFKDETGEYGYIPSFSKHQEIKKPSKWHFAELPETFIDELPTSTPLVGEQLPSSPLREKEKEKEKEKESIKEKYGTFKNVLLTTEEYKRLKERFNSHVEEMIERLSEGIESKGYKYKSHYAAILSWERMNKERNIKPAQKTNNDEPVKGW